MNLTKKFLLQCLCLSGLTLSGVACSKGPTHPNDSMENGRVLAFPGAEGFGRFAMGARGVAQPEVYIVNNLNDSGAGSFRDAVSKPGRFIVFAVSGIIQLASPLSVAANLTIAGQTAPGKGVVLYGRKVTFTGANQTIARYLRIRLGANGGGAKNEDASGIANGRNIILDHMSFSWGQDEVFSINWDNKGNEPDSITIQYTIIGQGLHRHNHSAGGLIQTGGKISILKSLYASNKTRNPKVKGYNEFVNNVVYNYGNEGNPMGHTVSGDAYIMGGSAGVSEVNIIHNYFISGPLTPSSKTTPFSRGTGTFFLYAAGNYFDANKNGVLDGHLVPADDTGYPGIADSNFMAQPFDYPAKDTKLSAKQAYQEVWKHAGAILPQRDEVDSLLMAELASKGTAGFYVYQETDLPFANDGLGEYPTVYAAPDADADGIPDEWEERMNLDAHHAADALQPNKQYPHYLNIEVYLNALAHPAS